MTAFELLALGLLSRIEVELHIAKLQRRLPPVSTFAAGSVFLSSLIASAFWIAGLARWAGWW